MHIVLAACGVKWACRVKRTEDAEKSLQRNLHERGRVSLYLEQPGEHRVSVGNKLVLVLPGSLVSQGRDN